MEEEEEKGRYLLFAVQTGSKGEELCLAVGVVGLTAPGG